MPILSQYKNQQIIFEPETVTDEEQVVAIKSKIIDGKLPDIDIVFKMLQNMKTKQWKIIDMEFEGLSFLSSKQAELNKG